MVFQELKNVFFKPAEFLWNCGNILGHAVTEDSRDCGFLQPHIIFLLKN